MGSTHKKSERLPETSPKPALTPGEVNNQNLTAAMALILADSDYFVAPLGSIQAARVL